MVFLETCKVKIVDKKVVCIEKNKDHKADDDKTDSIIKQKQKLNHLKSIGMDLTKYHPSVLKTMIDGGRSVNKIPDNIKQQLIAFAQEAHDKGFSPALFGYNNTLHKHIKSVTKAPTRAYIKKHVRFQGKGLAPIVEENIMLKVKEPVSSSESSSGSANASESSESESSSESETDLDGILSEVEHDIKGGKITAVKKKLRKYKHRIPSAYYNKIMNGLFEKIIKF